MAYITPLVINALGGGHTDTHAYQCANQSNFKKPGVRGQRPREPDLKNCIQDHDYSKPSLVDKTYGDCIQHHSSAGLSLAINRHKINLHPGLAVS